MKCLEQANLYDGKQTDGCLNVGGGKWGVTAKGYEFSFWGDEKCPKDCSDGCITVDILKIIELHNLNR